MNRTTKTDIVFHALANRARRKMMDIVKAAPGCSVNDLCEHFDTSRIAVMKHLKVLVAANLVISTKKGRTRELFFNAAPIQLIYDRWTTEYSAFWATQVVDLKYRIEQSGGKQKNNKSEKEKKPAAQATTKRSRKTKKSRTARKKRDKS